MLAYGHVGYHEVVLVASPSYEPSTPITFLSASCEAPRMLRHLDDSEELPDLVMCEGCVNALAATMQ